MSEHTKLPWKKEAGQKYPNRLISMQVHGTRKDNNGRAIADFYGPDAEDNIAFVVKASNSFRDLLTACEDPFSYEYGENPTFADALLNLGDNLGKLDETAIAIWKLWLLKKAEDLQAAIKQTGTDND